MVLTRLAVFFQSTDPPAVGPVRSVRTSDLSVVAPANGVLVASGGSGITLQTLRGAGTQVLDGGSGYARDRGRRAPYNVLVSLPQTRAALGAWRPSRPYLLGDNGCIPLAGAASAAEVGWPSGRTRWTYDPERAGSVMGTRLPTGSPRPTCWCCAWHCATPGNATRPGPVPEVVLTGGGDATLFGPGIAVPARWAKNAPTEPLELTGPDGAPLPIPPGADLDRPPADGPCVGSVVTRPAGARSPTRRDGQAAAPDCAAGTTPGRPRRAPHLSSARRGQGVALTSAARSLGRWVKGERSSATCGSPGRSPHRR